MLGNLDKNRHKNRYQNQNAMLWNLYKEDPNAVACLIFDVH